MENIKKNIKKKEKKEKMKNNLKTIIKSKYFIPLLIEIFFISILGPCLGNCFIAKEEDLLKLLNEYGIHQYTIFLIIISFTWTLFIIFLYITTIKIDKLLKDKK